MIKFYLGLILGLLVGGGMGLFMAAVIQSTKSKLSAMPNISAGPKIAEGNAKGEEGRL